MKWVWSQFSLIEVILAETELLPDGLRRHTPRFLPSSEGSWLWCFSWQELLLTLRWRERECFSLVWTMGVQYLWWKNSCVSFRSHCESMCWCREYMCRFCIWRYVGIWMCVCGVCMWVEEWVLDFALFPRLSFKEMRSVPIWAGDLLHFKLYHNVN